MTDGFSLVIPTATILSVLLCIFGPLYLPKFHVIFLCFFFLFFSILSFTHAFKFRKTVSKILDAVSSSSDLEAKMLLASELYYTHVFVIPNYQEPLPLLRKTIALLAAQNGASSRYVIVLAMEETEMGHLEKSNTLKNEFESRFQHFIVTVHPSGIPGEARGKGSNVNHAVREACASLVKSGLSMEQMILTISDSDAEIPELYVHQLEHSMIEAADPLATVFCPPIFFSRNADKVPAVVRVTDIMWSVMVMQNLSNSRGIMFPCSTYSLSMVLADKVNYWDTDFDAIGEDMHMMLKCFFKTNGDARAMPIYVPINLTNVQTESYLSNVYARYVQAARHHFGVADVAYALRHASQPSEDQTSSSSILDRMLVCFHIFEAHLIPATTGWLLMLALLFFQLLNPSAFDASPQLQTVYSLVKILSVLPFIPLVMNILAYEHLHHSLDRQLFKKEKRTQKSSFKWLDYCWLPFSAFFYMTLPSTVCSIKKAIPNREEKYIVSEKMAED